MYAAGHLPCNFQAGRGVGVHWTPSCPRAEIISHLTRISGGCTVGPINSSLLIQYNIIYTLGLCLRSDLRCMNIPLQLHTGNTGKLQLHTGNMGKLHLHAGNMGNLQVTFHVACLARWMAVDLYIREIDALRFELSMVRSPNYVEKQNQFLN